MNARKRIEQTCRAGGEPPKGWGNQLLNKALGNLNYEYRHRIYMVQAASYAHQHFASDLAFGAQAAAGNLTTFVRRKAEF